MMRWSFTCLMLMGLITVSAVAQPPVPPPIRYEVSPQLQTFAQSTPKETLASAIKLLEKERFDYLAAQIIDHKFIDSRVRDRAKPLEEAIDADLRREREVQRQDPIRFPLGKRLPDDPKEFTAIVEKIATDRAFKLVVKDIRGTFTEHPDHLKDFRKFLREGIFTETGETASCTHKDIKDRAIYFRKAGEYWTIDDKQKADTPKN
jgi:histone deacetylase complex regulatory component SIN3